MAALDLRFPGADQLNENDVLAKSVEIESQYSAERAKRLRDDGLTQYIDTMRNEKFRHFASDPWAASCETVSIPVNDGFQTKVLIVGAGFVSLLFAGRLIEKGFKPEDFIFVDSAAGFGGVWYWNRYPGLMCDVESYIYLPLIEATGYVPKHKYSYGQELRDYANLLAKTLGVDGRGVFRASVMEATWDEASAQWNCELQMNTGQKITVHANFFIMASGVLSRPKLPGVPGIESFKGHCFHTSRWDYKYTGGSQEKPELVNLKDKRVAIIGTGATSIQIVPEVAKWAKELVVVQRTPAAVDVRNQQETDTATFKEKVASHPGWQKDRMINFASFLSNVPEKPKTNLVADAWTTFPSFSGVVGGPHVKSITPENLPQYINIIHKLDIVRQDRVRRRVTETVKDAETAKALQPWYSGFCKRPCFHDDYLEAFNEPNVRIIDTNGKGVEGFTEHGIISNGTEHELDVIIFSTGFEPFTVGSPAFRAGIKVKGRGGLDMDDKWADRVGTLHGVFSRGFPNLILTGYAQAGATVNQIHQMGIQAEHAAYALSEGLKRAAANDKEKVVIEPTEAAEEEWANRVLAQSQSMAILLNCTPSYTTAEGALRADLPQEVQLKAARGATWGHGVLDYAQVLEEWEAQGNLEGLEVTTV